MKNDSMKSWLSSSYLFGENRNWIEQLYEDFLNNPNSVDISWRSIFQQFLISTEDKSEKFYSKARDHFFHFLCNYSYSNSTISNYRAYEKQMQVLQLIEAYRLYGHRNANLDPIKLRKREKVIDLDPLFYNLTENDLHKNFHAGSFPIDKEIIQLSDLIKLLKKTYCDSIGIEYMHISSIEEKRWIQRRFESIFGRDNFSSDEKKEFLSGLIAAEELELYLNARFPGAKRFSLEGSDVLIPMLKEMFRHAVDNNVKEVVLGMSHRGRLNVLINVLGKKPQDVFNEFSGEYKIQFGTGDVKYHMGFSSNIKIKDNLLHLTLIFNPSHLEIINPVVMGSVRARLERLDGSNRSNRKKILPIIIHGDAAISGQGVVQETLSMSKARGYEVGGTVHIVINNQIGFTTSNPLDSHSTTYCTDIGKIVQAPIFHVNADDQEAVMFIARLALDFRDTFEHDVFIDLVCYRRRGHNEADEPSVTQPIMYQKIKKHPTLLKIYSDQLKIEKVVSQEGINEMIKLYRTALDTGECMVKEHYLMDTHSCTWSSYLIHEWDENYSHKIEIKYLKDLAKRISDIPKKIKMQSHVAKIYADRQAMAMGEKLFDWGSAENLAYATLVSAGIPVRLSGEDSCRGAFFHRHAVIYDQSNGSTYIPLQNIHKGQSHFRVWNSILSEEAVLAFEYGYAITDPRTLTIWEAQFGDFANSAQVVIDQFICSGEQKWGRMCGLVMFLPHGHEGQGPEHSSARLERYLQLCAQQNIQVCIPSTPAQFYHMLRRQALRSIRRPLIVMSPKSLLRHSLSVSSLNELAYGTFMPVIGEIDNLNPRFVNRIVMCSGKVYYDLLEKRRKNNQRNVGIVRVEQLYPFPYHAIQKVLKIYAHIHDFIWCQEEPFNQGAWHFSQHRFREVIPCNSTLRYVGRPALSSPAAGCISIHQQQQRDLVNAALNVD